jgi:hypothetical protein
LSNVPSLAGSGVDRPSPGGRFPAVLRLSIVLCLAWIASLGLAATALADTYDTATLVRITPLHKDDVRILSDQRIDIVGVENGRYRALVTPEQMQTLTRLGLSIEVLYGEMEEDRKRWAEAALAQPASPGAAAPTSYYTPSKFTTVSPPAGSLMEHLLALANANPSITRLYNLGASQDGAYDIIAMKVSKNPDVVEAEPKIRLYGNIHGDEKGGVMVTCDVLDTILAGYVAVPPDPTAVKLVDESEMWFIPIGNPYGNAHSTRYNSRGIDLNRNFWGPAGSDAPPAWSEKETQAIRDLTEAVTPDHTKKRFAVSLSFHEGDIVFNSVWNYTTSAPTDEPVFWSSRTGGTGCGSQTIPNCPTIAPHGLADAYRLGVTTPGFWYTEGYDWYGTKGDTNDWAYGMWADLDTTIELNVQKTPAASQIPVYTAQHRQAVINYMLKAFQGIHGVMTDAVTGLPLDGTVTATATASPSIAVPHPYQPIFTDPVAGDFHRVLQPGTYTIVCSAPGYMPTTITGLVVSADTKTFANCPMSATGIVYGSSTVTDSCSGTGVGGGDGILDAGEDATLAVTVTNPGSAAATGVTGTLTTTLPGITITQATASFTNVPGGGSGTSLPPHFRFSVGTGIACGTAIPFALHMTSAQGSWDTPFTVLVGQSSSGTPQVVVNESFDGTTFPPAGWTQADTSGTAGNWARSTGTVHPTGGGTHSGAGLAYFNSYTSSSGSATRLYRTGGFSIPSSATAASVSFWMYHDTHSTTSNDTVQVQVSTNGTTWTSVGSPVSRYDGTTGWAQATVSLAGFIGQSSVQVGFLGSSAFGYDCHIDDVVVSYTPPGTCTMHACTPAAADLAATASASVSAPTGGNITASLGVTNSGPAAAASPRLSTATPPQTTFVSMSVPPGWNCTTPAAGGTGPVTCTAATLPAGGSAGFSLVTRIAWCAGNGTQIVHSATVSSATNDPAMPNNVATAATSVVDSGACDDGNICSTGDACASGSCAGAPVGAPAEVSIQGFVTRTTDSWTPVTMPAGIPVTYDIARGIAGQWPVGSGASEVCLASQLPAASFDIAELPPSGAAFWYLVRAHSACGVGTFGTTSGGTPRVTGACP